MPRKTLSLLSTTAAAAGAAALLSMTGCTEHAGATSMAVPLPVPSATPAPMIATPAPPGAPPGAPPAMAPAAPPAKPPGGAPAAGALSACRSGTCEVEVTSGQFIPLDPALGLDPILVIITGDQVTFKATHGNDVLVSSNNLSQPNVTTRINGIVLKPRLVRPGVIRVSVSRA